MQQTSIIRGISLRCQNPVKCGNPLGRIHNMGLDTLVELGCDKCRSISIFKNTAEGLVCFWAGPTSPTGKPTT